MKATIPTIEIEECPGRPTPSSVSYQDLPEVGEYQVEASNRFDVDEAVVLFLKPAPFWERLREYQGIIRAWFRELFRI